MQYLINSSRIFTIEAWKDVSSLCAIFHLCMGEILVFLHYSICFSLLRVFAYLIHSVRDVNYMLLHYFFFSLGSVSFCFVQMKLLLQHQRLNHPFPIKGSYFFHRPQVYCSVEMGFKEGIKLRLCFSLWASNKLYHLSWMYHR